MHSTSRHLHVLQSMENLAPNTKTWAQQWDDLKTMWNDGMPTEEIAENLGRSVSAVLTQAARLGLSRRQAPGRKAKTAEDRAQKKISIDYVGDTNNVIAFHGRDEALQDNVVLAPRHEKKDRNCLMCSTSFSSHGSHNRICPRCKTGSAYQVGHDESFRVLSA